MSHAVSLLILAVTFVYTQPDCVYILYIHPVCFSNSHVMNMIVKLFVLDAIAYTGFTRLIYMF